MADAVGTTSSCLDGLSESYRTIAHNLANAGTVGFKRGQPVFMEVLAGRMEGQAAQVVGKVAVDFSPGAMTYTGRPTDLGIGGSGFFVIETSGGELYTRNGTFTLDSTRHLVDTQGRIVAGRNGPITLPPNAAASDVAVSPDGAVSAGGQSVGQLKIVEIAKLAQLKPVGGGCFALPKDAEVAPAKDPKVQQGFQEASNVNPVEEMVGLISIARLYEANVKTIKAVDDRLDSLTRVVL
ncbi:MAG: flagellar basal-body rod protein FlgF [Planctomycetaceae bacterium]|nr:flagellar basal-body rod protein FlgF [Planctomycetaceae bacterium]